MIGSANSELIPCIFEGDNQPTKVTEFQSSRISNIGTTDCNYFFTLPLPTNRGGLKLYIKGWLLPIKEAGIANYITSIDIKGKIHSGETTLDNYTTNLTSANDHTNPFTAVDCSSYDGIQAVLARVVASANALDIDNIYLDCYYDE